MTNLIYAYKNIKQMPLNTTFYNKQKKNIFFYP